MAHGSSQPQNNVPTVPAAEALQERVDRRMNHQKVLQQIDHFLVDVRQHDRTPLLVLGALASRSLDHQTDEEVVQKWVENREVDKRYYILYRPAGELSDESPEVFVFGDSEIPWD